MTNHQAVNLRPGARIRRKQPSDDNAIFVVERVAHPANRAGYRAARRARLSDHAPRGAPPNLSHAVRAATTRSVQAPVTLGSTLS